MSSEYRIDANNTTEHSKYPAYQIIQCPGGHRLEIGNEAGKECIKLYTAGGSTIEWKPDGSMMQVIIGDAQQYYKGGKTETVDENSDVNIMGHSRTTVGKGEHKEVVGDSGSYVAGKTAMYSKGQMSMDTAEGMYIGAKGSIGINSSQGMKIHVKGDMELNVTGALKLKGDGGVTINGQTVHLNKPGESSGSSEYSAADVPVS